jgi:RluA family pseudouridine synthase
MGGCLIELLFENEALLAANKPEGLATLPEADQAKDYLVGRLEAQLGRKLYVLHRLDKEVSGVIILAKDAITHRSLSEQFAKRTIGKRYLALTHGLIQAEHGEIDAPLRAFGSGRMGVDVQKGKPSQTAYTVCQRFQHYTLVQASPLTGRRHQLRVHFYHIGHPLVGDRRYGDGSLQRTFPRLLLHAQSIAFCLPNGEPLTVSAPPPPSFEELVERLAIVTDPYSVVRSHVVA